MGARGTLAAANGQPRPIPSRTPWPSPPMSGQAATRTSRMFGRWSRRVAPEFLAWLSVPPGRRWLDVGCGTGALIETVLELSAPSIVRGVDPSDGYVACTRRRIGDPRAGFDVGTPCPCRRPTGASTRWCPARPSTSYRIRGEGSRRDGPGRRRRWRGRSVRLGLRGGDAVDAVLLGRGGRSRSGGPGARRRRQVRALQNPNPSRRCTAALGCPTSTTTGRRSSGGRLPRPAMPCRSTTNAGALSGNGSARPFQPRTTGPSP